MRLIRVIALAAFALLCVAPGGPVHAKHPDDPLGPPSGISPATAALDEVLGKYRAANQPDNRS